MSDDDDNILLMSDDELDAAHDRASAEAEATTSEPTLATGERTKAPKKLKVLDKKKLRKFKQDYEMRGIVYISRIPPHMKPLKIRQLLSEHGEVMRVYCEPEDPRFQRERKLKGKDSGKNFTEGWVEFKDKRIAKRAAAMLNGQAIGGKKRSAYHYDLWCIKYLPKFKWDHLTEQMRYERAVRQQRLAAEVSAANRERDFYLSRVDKAKEVGAIKERRQKKQRGAGGEEGAAAAPVAEAQPGPSGSSAEQGGAREGGAEGRAEAADRPVMRKKRFFGQRQGRADPLTSSDAPQLPDDFLQLVAPAKKKQRAAV